MLINLFISAAFIWILLVAVYRILVLAGVPITFTNKKILSYLKPSAILTEEPTKRDYVILAMEAFTFRIIVYICSALAIFLFSKSGENFHLSTFLDSWHQWDASNYIRIATGGYTFWLENGEPTTLVFFPLYAWLIKLGYVIFRNYDVSAMVISTICYTIGILYMFGFVAGEYGKSVAYKAVLYLSIFPFGFFFGAMMPESVFLLTSSAFLYYLRKHNWYLVAVFGFLSSLSRMQGVLLLIPAGIEWLECYRPIEKIVKKNWKEFFSSLPMLLLLCSSLIGTGIYLFINYLVAGDCFKFLQLQETVWNHHYEYVGSAVSRIFDYLFADSVSMSMKVAVWLPEAVIVVLTVVLLLYGVNKHKPKYTLYLTAYTIISFSASYILSGGRYMSVAIPLFIILAKWLDEKTHLHRLYVAFSLFLMFLYMTGYLLGYQIM